MTGSPKTPIWPFLCILTCLFVLVALAPRSYRRGHQTADWPGQLPSGQLAAHAKQPSADGRRVTAPPGNAKTVLPAIATVPSAASGAPPVGWGGRSDHSGSMPTNPAADAEPPLPVLKVVSATGEAGAAAQGASAMSAAADVAGNFGFPEPPLSLLPALGSPHGTPIVAEQESLATGLVAVTSQPHVGTVEGGLAPPGAASLLALSPQEPPDLAADSVLASPEMPGLDGPKVELPSPRPSSGEELLFGPPSPAHPESGERPTSEGTGNTVSGPQDRAAADSAPLLPESLGPDTGAAGRFKPLAWHQPEELFGRLARLESHRVTRDWATATRQAVERLGRAFAADWAEVGTALEHLQQLSAEVPELATGVADHQAAKELLRAGHALERRLGIWGVIYRLGAADSRPEAAAGDADTRRLSAAVEALDHLLPPTPEGNAWREYLLIDSLRASLTRGAEPSAQLRAIAQQVVRRTSQTPLGAEQQKFLALPPLVALLAELRLVAAEPIEPGRLLADLERYEQTRLPSDAERLAGDCQWLLLSPDPGQRHLGRWVEAYYRNANVRLCVAAELLNRWMPRRDPEYLTVQDTVLGRPVRARSMTSADVMVRTLPDPHHVRLALEVSGHVASLSSSWAGPARFWSDSNAVYVARLPIQLDLSGIQVGQTQVQVFNNVRLRDLETDFDRIPLVGALAQGVARAQHEQSLPAANQEVRYKIAQRARERIEAETSQQLASASRRLEEQVLLPLRELTLCPVLINAATDERRFAMRVRVAGDDQLGSQTPRPQAPSDSLASFQFHETVLNNALARLELAGRTFSLDELAVRISERLKCARPWEPNPEHEDVTITFAASDPIGVHFEDGQVVVTVAVAQLSKPPQSWEDFQVQAFYQPEIDGRSARLVREGVIRLIGPRLNFGSQIALRGIFSRTFSRERPWELTPQRVRESAELRDLEITQFVLEDGWAGIALGPRRTAPQRTAMSGR